MVHLYIENQLIELDQEVQFAITKTFEDITNPTSIINDWSKTVSIPFTQHNNNVFGHIYNPDRLTLHGSEQTPITGLYFDPLKKLNFRLEWGNAILMSGYAKMTSITKTNGTGKYNITLNGELGKVFQEMKKITFDETKYTGVDKDKYWIDGSKYVKEIIDKHLIYNLWTNEPNFEDITLHEKYLTMLNPDTMESTNKINLNYKTVDILGFAPNNSFNEDFDYTTFQVNDNQSKTFAEVLDNRANQLKEGATYGSLTGIDSETVIGDGLLPRDIGEYRSYLQLPYIYFNKLMQIFIKKVKEISGYTIKLDEMWFNKHNPFWTHLIYMLKPLNVNKSESVENTYSFSTLVAMWGVSYEPTKKLNLDLNVYKQLTVENIPVVDWEGSKKPFNVEDKVLIPQGGYNGLVLMCEAQYDKGERITSYLSNKNGLVIELSYVYDNGVKKTFKYLYQNEGTTTPDGYNQIFKLGAGDISNAFYTRWNLEVPLAAPMYEIEGAKSVYLEAYAYWLNDLDCFDNCKYGQISSSIYAGVTNFNVFNNNNHSFASFTLNDIWDNSVDIFNEIINFCKMFRLGVFCDNINKVITIEPFSTYFNRYSIENWDSKLDLSKSFEIKPITFENKYVKFNYNAVDTKINNEYVSETGVNFGEYKLETNYNFNNEEKELFSGVKNSITATDNILSWGNLYDNAKIIYTLPAEIHVNNKDKDKKAVDLFGSFWLYNGLGTFDTSNSLRPVSITDDTSLQLMTQTFFYTQGITDNFVKVPTYPKLDIKREGDPNLSIFGTPVKSFVYLLDYFNDTKGIYYNFWQKYLDERYNPNNKIVTCYLDITPQDYMNFQFNKFIKIGNQLYIINKIYDYDITDNSPTKVDLVTIQDISGYTDSNYFVDFFQLYGVLGNEWDEDFDYIPLEPCEEMTIWISSATPVTWSNNYTDDNSLCSLEGLEINGVTIDSTTDSGIIEAGIKVPVKFNNSYSNGVSGRGKITFSSETGFSKTVDINLIKTGVVVFNGTNKIHDNETIEIGTETGISTLNLSVSSIADVNIYVQIESGSVTDVNVNGENVEDKYQNQEYFNLISAGVRQPLIISTLSGGDDFKIKVILSNTNGDSTQFYVNCVW